MCTGLGGLVSPLVLFGRYQRYSSFPYRRPTCCPQMILLPGLLNVATRFLGRFMRKDCLDRLPNDVLVDVVFDYLDVCDIIRMRRVSGCIPVNEPFVCLRDEVG